MANGVTVGFTFQTQSGPIPLSELDSNFSSLQAAINSMNSYTNYLVDTSGAANVITVSLPAGQTGTYVAGLGLQIAVANTTTITNPTINLNSLGTRTVINPDGSALAVGQIIAGQYIDVLFDGTSFRLMSQGGSTATPIGNFKQLVVGPPTSGVALTVNGIANQNTISVNGSSTSGQSFGIIVSAGTTSADYGLLVDNIGGHVLGKLVGDGSFFLGFNGSASTITGSASGAVAVVAPSTNVIALTVTGVATNGFYAAEILTGAVAGSRGLYIHDQGSGSSGFPLVIDNGTNNLLTVSTDGGVQIGQSPTGGDEGLGTINVASGYYVNGGVVSLGSIVVKQASTTSRSTSTLSNDATFTVSIPGAGTYNFTIFAELFNASAGAGTVTYNMNYSGTITSSNFSGNGAFAASTGPGSGSTISTTVAGSTSNVTTQTLGAGGSFGVAGSIVGTLICTNSGTLALAWGTTTTGAGTTLGAGTFVVTRVV
jgi:hypothetical protein